jgi:hypothetical protein
MGYCGSLDLISSERYNFFQFKNENRYGICS